MKKFKLFEHISLDGIIQVRGSGEDDYLYGDWTAPYRTPAGRDAILAAYGESFDLLLGRRSVLQSERRTFGRLGENVGQVLLGFPLEGAHNNKTSGFL